MILSPKLFGPIPAPAAPPLASFGVAKRHRS